jgi:DNA helicase II / ATP-dependent DNA helicase PcrA
VSSRQPPAASRSGPTASPQPPIAFLKDLNPEQRVAVEQIEGPLLILAGAGSGKTRVIAYRVAHLIGGGYAEEDEVLAVTFTNKAAEEMRGRVASLLGSDVKRLWISTFHALCARLLRREGPAIGLSRDFVIYDAADQLTAVRQALRELELDEKLVPPRLALASISHAKNRMERIEATLDKSLNYREEQIAKVSARYSEILVASGALDFDDLLLKTVELFESAAAVRDRYAHRFRFVMIDEYQDTNRPQYLLVRHLASIHRNLAVVGDPDQSIYRWRGADVRNILDFEADFPDARIVHLERNYRSTQVILDAASALIRNNPQRQEKRLWTERGGGAPIIYSPCGDEIEEADFIVRTLRAELSADPSCSGGVLYRINAQSRAIEEALTRAGVPYRIVGGVRFYERKEIKDALAYLKLLLNPHDDVSFRRVVNTPPRGIGKSVMDALEGGTKAPAGSDAPPLVAALIGDEQRASLWSRTEAVVASRRLAPRAHAALKGFHDLIVAMSETARHERVSAVLGKVLHESGYVQDLRDDRSEESDARLENLAELVSAAKEYETRDESASLAGFVDRLSLLSEADEVQGAAQARVSLMTLHSAKGLEFPIVFLPGLEDGLLPHARGSEDERELEEERRLCYVGITRACRQLYLSSAARRRVFGEYQSTRLSRFLEEIPAELVEVVEAPSVSAFRRAPAQRGPYGLSRTSGRVREEPAAYSYEDEDQSIPELRPGMRVRHPMFGVGTVVSVHPDATDLKLIVRFPSVGQKRLVARFAGLKLA